MYCLEMGPRDRCRLQARAPVDLRIIERYKHHNCRFNLDGAIEFVDMVDFRVSVEMGKGLVWACNGGL